MCFVTQHKVGEGAGNLPGFNGRADHPNADGLTGINSGDFMRLCGVAALLHNLRLRNSTKASPRVDSRKPGSWEGLSGGANEEGYA